MAGFLASGFWKHFLCFQQRLAFAVLGAGQAGGPAEALPSHLACPLCTSSIPQTFSCEGPCQEDHLFPQAEPLRGAHTESPVPILPRVLHRLPHESDVPFSFRRAWLAALVGTGPHVPAARLDFALSWPRELSWFPMWQPSQCLSSPCRRARNSKQRSMPR